MAIVTTHAERRTRKRLGLPKKSAGTNAERALRCGVLLEETKSSLRRFLEGAQKQHPENDANNVIIYNRSVYIFCDDVLITVFSLPRKWHSVADELCRRKKEKLPFAESV